MRQNKKGEPDRATLAALIDHTALKPDTAPDRVEALCAEAVEYGFACVCVNPCYVERAASCLQGTTVKPCTVIGFPLGAATSRTKAAETSDALENGAREVDMVLNIGMLKAGQDAYVSKDIGAVVQAAGTNALVKVIIETPQLTEEEKIRACHLAVDAGAGFVKTATGFLGGGATVADVRLLRKAVGQAVGVKAAGGIRDYRTACAMVEAGANRIGTSSSIAIMQEA